MLLPKHKCLEKILLIAFMFLPTLTISLNLDNDFWFLVNQGKYIMENGFPVVEPFTIHADLNFMIQQWLFDVVVYCLYSALGKAGIITLVCLAALVIRWLIYKLCMLLSDRKFYLSVLITTFSYLLICMWFMVSRPQIITYIILLTEIFLLEKYVRGENWKWIIPLPFLSLLLINCHSSMWWLLIVFVVPYLIETLKIRLYSLNLNTLNKWPLYITTFLMVVAGFINPYGAKAIIYIFQSYGDKTINSSIVEMSAPDVKSLNGMIFFATLAFVILCYVLNRSGKSELRYIVLAFVSSLLALMSIKSIPYFLFGTFIPLSYFLKNIAGKLVFDFGEKSKRSMNMVVVFMAFIYLISIYVMYTDYDSSQDYPSTQNAIGYLVENEDVEKIALYTSFYDGGYAEYKGIKTYIDARAEVFLDSNNKKENIFLEYILLQKGALHYESFLNKYEFTHILVTESDVLNVYLSKDENYTIYYEDEKGKIYIPIQNS